MSNVRNQQLFGSYNRMDEEAQMIIGRGSKEERKTIAKVANDGTFKSGDGSRLLTTINGIAMDVKYTDPTNEAQIIQKTDNR